MNAAEIKQVFAEALELPADRRRSFIQTRCGADPELLAAVTALLDAHASAGGFLAGPTVEPTGDAPSNSRDAAPRQIGRYRILATLGEGGFGTVYLAEQAEPVRRRVALKIIKLGMDSRQVLGRFEAEQQALAVMDHPNIAKVFDAGATDAGRPYFVMELVTGVPITQYCDQHRIGITARLELFAQVCQAVQHAHTKGIVHRDLKPSNILVSQQDGAAFVKVIDFGIAKATQARLTERTVFTEFHQLIGTPEYMSPEQAASGLDIDTRSDIYSLGVLLYELLTGSTPFDARDLRSKAYDEIQRVIREVEPPRPSTRLSMNQETIASVAAVRGVEPRRLSRAISGDLDWIVMRCLEKDRARRYETAAALAADVVHYLHDEPVSAGPPTFRRQAHKLVHRYKLVIGVAAVIFLALSAGLAVATYGLVRARQERDAAVAARKAESEAREYERQSDRFLRDMLTSIDPEEARGREVPVREVLDNGARRLDDEPPTHKLVEASLRFAFGNAYLSLGKHESARLQLQRACELYRTELGPSHTSTLKAQSSLANCLKELGRLSDAESLYRECLPRFVSVLGENHGDTLALRSDLGLLLSLEGKNAEADTILTDVLARMKQSGNADLPTRLNIVNNLASLRDKQGHYAESISLTREALAETKANLGDDSPWTIALMNNLADTLRITGQFDEALVALRQTREMARRVFGVDHPSTLTLSNNLGLALEAMGQYDEAESVYLDTIERRTRVLGDEHPSTLLVRGNFALLLQSTRRYDEAEAIFREVAAKYKRVLGDRHPDSLIAENNIAWLLVQRGNPAAGAALFADLLPRVVAALGSSHPLAVSIRLRLGTALADQQKWNEAEPLLAEAYTGSGPQGSPHRQLAYTIAYGDCLVHLGRYSDAIPVLREAESAAKASPRKNPTIVARISESLALAESKAAPATNPSASP